jgi:3-hydroxy-3-methylglutaryl CoA synthase
MVGITSYGAYIPRYRLGRDIVAKAWGPPGSSPGRGPWPIMMKTA